MSDPNGTPPANPNNVTLTSAPGGEAVESGEIVAPPGYELIAEIGRGGMGIVFRARDLELGRDVAVKILQPHYDPNSTSGNRFVEEARITGRLQHPGIPAIYRVGTLSNGLPFLAMKLIGGRTLDELLKERTDRAADRGRFLAVFEQIAQAVGYAHKEGVIHRDLKPSNVMVGEFGEVQVMDWGLGKSADRVPQVSAMAEPTATVEYSPHAMNNRNAEATLAGAVLGTPAYMPPEQAIGAIDQIGKPSDVFGLGAILCVILTGEPPYAADTIEGTRQLAARAKLETALTRLNACGAEPDLVALAKHCLAPEPGDRPRDAGEVAVAVATLRSDAERRARHAEMNRARDEVKRAEERKRRRVQRALALSMLGLVAVAGLGGWWIDQERARRRADHQAEELRKEAAANERIAELKAEQLVTEHDVNAALNEAQTLREQGWRQAEDPAHWALTLQTAHSTVKRADAILDSGVATDELRNRVSAMKRDLDRDGRDRTLLAELDRVADGNEIRVIIPVSLSGVTSRKYATAFRMHGIDLMTVPTDEAVAWLKAHRFRSRLVIAIRNWQQSYPTWDVTSVIDQPLADAITASAAVAGYMPIAAIVYDKKKPLENVLRKQAPHARLSAILKALTDDSFTKEWWDAAARRDIDTMKKMIQRPEMRQFSSRELASLSEALNPQSGLYQVLFDFLDLARDRFPGEFWIHFRLALHGQFGGIGKKKDDRPDDTIRHLTAAVAARPSSAVARAALGMELIEKRKGDPEGPRMIRSAAEIDPTSPWPHFFLGMMAMEENDWPESSRSFVQCVRADPDTGFFMIYSITMFMFMEVPTGRKEAKNPTAEQLEEFIRALIAARPEHPGGYDLHASYLMNRGKPREALALYNKSKTLIAPDYPGRLLIAPQVSLLESQARWESKLPAVLRGELEPANSGELSELAGYCASFDKNYLLAIRFAEAALKKDANLRTSWSQVSRFAGWAVQASLGNGVDAAKLSPAERRELRMKALAWLRESVSRVNKETGPSIGTYLYRVVDLEPVRDSKLRAKLPKDEQDEWIKFWLEIAPMIPKDEDNDVAPPPRVKKP